MLWQLCFIGLLAHETLE